MSWFTKIQKVGNCSHYKNDEFQPVRVVRAVTDVSQLEAAQLTEACPSGVRIEVTHALSERLLETALEVGAELAFVRGSTAGRARHDLLRSHGIRVAAIYLRAPTDSELVAAEGTYADVMTRPLAAPELAQHLASLLGVAASPRVQPLRATLCVHGCTSPVEGEVLSVSPVSASVRAPVHVLPGQQISLRFVRGDERTDGIRAHVREVVPARDFDRITMSLQDVGHAATAFLRRECWYQLDGDGDCVVASLRGELTQTTDVDSLMDALAGAETIVFDAAELVRVTAAGFTAWRRAVQALDCPHVVVRRCSVPFARCASQMATPFGAGSVTSTNAPYTCSTCGEETTRLVETLSVTLDECGNAHVPSFACNDCGGALELDDEPDRLFAFVRGAPAEPAPTTGARGTSAGRHRSERSGKVLAVAQRLR